MRDIGGYPTAVTCLIDIFLSQHQKVKNQKLEFYNGGWVNEGHNLKSVRISQNISAQEEDMQASFELDNTDKDYSSSLINKEVKYTIEMDEGGWKGPPPNYTIPAMTVFRGKVADVDSPYPYNDIKVECRNWIKNFSDLGITGEYVYKQIEEEEPNHSFNYTKLTSWTALHILTQIAGFLTWPDRILSAGGQYQKVNYFWADGNFMSILRELVESEGGEFYNNDTIGDWCKGGVFHSYSSLGIREVLRVRQGCTIFSSNIFELSTEQLLNEIRNEITVKIHNFTSEYGKSYDSEVLWWATGESIMNTDGDKSWVADFNLQTLGQEMETIVVPCISVCSLQSGVDYKVNSKPDGSGYDWTSLVTKESQYNYAIKSFFTFSSAFASGLSIGYFTKLQVRGQPVKDSVTSKIFKDTTSIDTYGKHSYIFDNKWIQGLTQAEKIGNILLEKYKDPPQKIKVRMPFFPMIQVNDVVGLSYPGIDPWGYLVEHTEYIKSQDKSETILILGRTICGLTEV